MYEVNQDYINFQKEVLLINLVFIKLWLHINDSTPKLFGLPITDLKLLWLHINDSTPKQLKYLMFLIY